MPLGQGSISLGGTTTGESIALELGLGATSTISLGDAAVYGLAGFGSTSNIDMLTFRGKSHVKEITSPTGSGANVQNLNIYNAAVAAGWDRVSEVTYTIASGAYIWSDSTSLAALDTGGAFPNGLTIYNGGYIMGKGGQGGNMIGSNNYTPDNATSGGPAITVTANCTIVNNGYIGGGGGGGASAGSRVKNVNYTNIYYEWYATGGGGAGGGKGGGYKSTASGTRGTPDGGAGGGIGAAGGDGPTYYVSGSYGGTFPWKLGGGGGRIMPGVGGTAVAATGTNGVGANGKGGGAGGSGACESYSNAGGGGGSAGNVGSNGATKNPGGGNASATGGGGGGWGASGGSAYRYSDGNGGSVSAAGAGGKAIAKNGYTVTTSGTGTTYGAVG
jgi:hypothetical protein